jgi:sodium transport system permease protein
VNRAFVTVFLKELRESFRDRRTMLSALLLGPLGGPLLFAVLMNAQLQRGAERAEEPVEIAVSGREHAPNLVAFLEQQGAVVGEFAGDEATATRQVRERETKLVLVIPAEFGERLRAGEPAAVRLYSDSSDTAASAARARAAALLEGYSSRLATQRLQARGLSPVLVQPVYVDQVDVATPAGRALLLLGMLSYFVIFGTLVGGMYVAIDATAGERERGSLEPLLTTAASRDAIAYGKIAAAAFFMAVSLALAVVGFAVALRYVPLGSLGMQANFGPDVAAKVFLLMLPFVVLGAAAMTLAASFTKSFREAQTWLTALMFVPTLPIIFAAIWQLQPSNALMWVPSMSQHLLITSLLRAEPLVPLHVLLSVGGTLALGVAIAWVAARLYRREGILG